MSEMDQQQVDMTYRKLREYFRAAERQGQHLTGYIVFSPASFEQPYPLESRTYAVSSDNKAFQPNMGGYSIYASSLDGSDPLVRLEQYMAAEYGGKDGWYTTADGATIETAAGEGKADDYLVDYTFTPGEAAVTYMAEAGLGLKITSPVVVE